MFLVSLVGVASQIGHATDLPGFYVGAGVGQSTVRVDQVPVVVGVSPVSGSFALSKKDTAWKFVGGLRPMSFIGAELEYLDFGSPTASHVPARSGLGYTIHTRSRAVAAFGVLYAAIPVPLLDVFGKVGLARLHSTSSGTEYLVPALGCPSPLCQSQATFNRVRADTRLAYGAGVQVKGSSLAIRGEYERISASTGDPSLLSIGLTWKF